MWFVAVIRVSFIGNCIACGSNVVMWLVAVIKVSCIGNCITNNDFNRILLPW
jgi:hypothetical protein